MVPNNTETSKAKYKRIIAIVTGVLMAAFSGCFIYYQVEYNTEGEFTWKIFQACIFDGRLLECYEIDFGTLVCR